MKTKEELFKQLNENPVFHLATIDNGLPKVRGMLLYRADGSGIIFHTGNFKDLHRQLQANAMVELCFHIQKTGEQIRIAGRVMLDTTQALIEEIYNHPTRGFLRAYGDEMKSRMAVYRLQEARYTVWTMNSNTLPTIYTEV